MVGFLLWLALIPIALVGPPKFWRSEVHRAERNCRCACGTVFGERMDLPPEEPPTTYRTSEWLGEHTIVCFPKGTRDVRARVQRLQDQANATYLRRWRLENDPFYKGQKR